jgi:uncharacterized protein YneF (UPF0154 family)
MMGGTDGIGSTDSSYTPWLIILIVIAALIVAAIIVYFVRDKLRDRQFEEASKKDPYLTRKEFRRRRKLSALERIEEEELQRSVMIRKSLATRSSRTNSQVTISVTMPEEHDTEMDEDVPAARLKDDWKEWEARMQRDRSNSAERHPFINAHSAGEITDLPLPQQSRTASPSRSPLLNARVSPPLPSPPTFTHRHYEPSSSTSRPAELRPVYPHRI